jgi:uncharacterized sporulation protein YeaH/YhbH (DUF444 family)
MSLSSIERDRNRFRDIVRGRLRVDLRRFLSTSELLGRRGQRSISIPLPQIELPRLRFGENPAGGGGSADEAGEGGQGDKRTGEGGGQAGDGEGSHLYEVEVELEELARMLGEELELPRIEARGRRQLDSEASRWRGICEQGPASLRHFRRTWRKALKRSIASGSYDPLRPRIVPLPEDERFRMRKPEPRPHSSAVIFHIMDVSGSMGREQKEIVRIKAFWIDTWLRSQYKNIDVVYIVHDAVAKEVDSDSFFHLRESGGTKISSAYELCLQKIQEHYPPEDWNIYPFHYSDGDNWSARDTERCISLLRDELLPRVNQFCYGQVKSAYGSGQFKKELDTALPQAERLVTVNVNDRDGIRAAIRAFLGSGR